MANSTHLYFDTYYPTTFNEFSFILRVIQKPLSDLVFFAGQVTMRQADGSNRGGVHFGLQTAQNLTSTQKTAVNWGGYDDITASTFRGSISSLTPNPNGGTPSPLFDWFADRDYLLRIFKSPKQNWVAAELDSGGDQAAGEIAWRFTITDLSTGTTTFVRDLLIPNCHTTAAMYSPAVWSEDFNDTTPPTATVPWDVRFSETRLDGNLATHTWADYAGSLTNTTLDTNDHVGFRIRSVASRSTSQGAYLNIPGPAIRTTTANSLGSATASSSLSLTAPPNTPAGELLIAFLTNDAGHTAPTAPTSDWILLESVAGADSARQSIYYRYHDGSSSSFTFTNNAVTNNYAGVLAAVYGADPIAPPVLGTSGISAGNVQTWSAPSMSKATNYGRVLTAISWGPWGGGSAVVWPTGVISIGDSSVVSTVNSVMSVGQEPILSPVGTAAAKSGTLTGTVWRDVARQVTIYPVLQRLVPSSDVSNSGWADAPLWSKINESVPSDAEFIVAHDTNVCVIALGAGGMVAPGTNEGHVLRYRVRRQDSASASVLVELLQTSTVIASKTETIASGNPFVWGSLTLTPTEAGSITDRAALRLRLTATLT